MTHSVLIVDDNEQDRKLLRYNFEWHGYQILEAANGLEALSLAISKLPGLIISDALMPEMDGFQLLREIKKKPELSEIPFIFYSSVYTGNREKEMALALGARAFIVKPLTADELWEEISRALLNGTNACTAIEQISRSDEEFLVEYSRIVAAKLEEKVRALEEANQRIAQSEARYRNLFASMRDVVIITDLSRTIIDVNQPALRTIFGYETDDVLGKSTSLLCADLAQFELAGKEIFNRNDTETGKLLELIYRRKSGAEFVGELHAMRMLGDDGKLAGNIGVIRDITERKRSATELEQSEAKFRRLSQEFNGVLDAIPDSLLLLDHDLKVLWANRATAEDIGIASEELSGGHCYNLRYQRTTPCESCPVLKCFESGVPHSETVTKLDDRIYDIRTVPLPDEQGRVTKVIEVKRDITSHKKLETQYLHAQKMESVGTLAGGVAHDFNNILTVIIGLGEITLMKMTDDNPQRHNIKGIVEAAERAAHLTRQLLLFSRKQFSERRCIDLNEVVGKTDKFLQRIIGADIELTQSFCAGPVPVLADSSQLEQVLMNLAVNAHDAMPHGGKFSLQTERIVLNEDFVATHGYGKPGEFVLLSVSDTGIGMDKATQQRIFEPFFTTKEVGKGTGLGLSVVYGIIKQHDGFIVVYSEPGHGTTFRIYLSLSMEAAHVVMPEKEQPIVGGTETILLAEDDALVRNLMTKVLTEAGYTLIEAVDGEEAIRLFQENKERIDLLLFDLIMPRMNGNVACDEIRKLQPGIKVIFSSGYAPDTIRQKASLEDGAHLISKPSSPKDLLRKVRMVLDE